MGATSYYYQQQVDRLHSQVSALDRDSTGRASALTGQVTQLTSTNSQLQDSNANLTLRVAKLEAQVAKLTNTQNRTQTVLVSQGQIPLTGYGAVAYINFTVPSNTYSPTLNISFTGVEFGVATRLSLLTVEQYQAFKICNCIYYGNYSSVSTTWSSPMAHSYTATVDVPYNGNWILAFQHGPGSGSTETFNETILMINTLKKN